MTDPDPTGPHVVAVDGPAAAGKTTASLVLARTFGLSYLESGLAYRLVAYLAQRHKVPVDDEKALIRLCRSLLGTTEEQRRIFEEAKQYNDVLRSRDVTRSVSSVSSMPGLRARITDLIRSWVMSRGNSVVEGRDIGTTVFPAATVKFYLTADPEVRARRRADDEGGRSYRDVLADVLRRDEADMSRATSPLTPAPDSVMIDTGPLSVDQVVAAMSKVCTDFGLTAPNVTARAS
jgi:cytidylate kinase